MIRLETLTRGAGLAAVSISLWSLAVGVIISGGFLIAVSTPCLCFEANGFMLLAGLIVILGGAAMMLWAGDVAKLVSDRVSKRFFRAEVRIDYAINQEPADC